MIGDETTRVTDDAEASLSDVKPEDLGRGMSAPAGSATPHSALAANLKLSVFACREIAGHRGTDLAPSEPS